MKRAPIYYHCDDCGRGIHATAQDPVHKPGHRTLCSKCVGKPAPVVEKKPDGRGAAARERWAQMTTAEKRARVRAMQAGREAAR